MQDEITEIKETSKCLCKRKIDMMSDIGIVEEEEKEPDVKPVLKQTKINQDNNTQEDKKLNNFSLRPNTRSQNVNN